MSHHLTVRFRVERYLPFRNVKSLRHSPNRFKKIDEKNQGKTLLTIASGVRKRRGFDPRVFLATIGDCRRLLTFRKGKYRSTRNLTVRWCDIEAHERC